MQLEPPCSLAELSARVAALTGCAVAELERRLGVSNLGPMRHRKGKTGELVERALGAVGGSLRGPDFPELGVELKTIPLDGLGRPRESTFVCSLNVRDADRMDWDSSLVRAKLACVLWVPILGAGAERQIGSPMFWRPSAQQLAVLRGDFDELVGMIAIGKVESLTARLGCWLQVRPKAANSDARARLLDEDGSAVWTVPRGFYLRARFTGALLRDPGTLTGSSAATRGA